jgi:DNA-binding SARP family transcriptional activator/tetratricopeptide (TPR) repeat protein
VHFRILGPLRVTTGESRVTLPPKERTVLARLLLSAGEVVSVAALAEALWDDDSPPSARNTIQGHVKRLRQQLGPAPTRITTRAPGYLIEVHPGELDLHTFTELRARARKASTTEAAELLRQALDLWHGPPLSDTPSAALQRTEVPRLTELRVEALEARINADLDLGRHDVVTAELHGLVAEHPFRERFWAQLMLALYRSGRQSDALAVYQQARTTLLAELGIEPGHQLQSLHQQILSGDPALNDPALSNTTRGTARPAAIPRQLPAGLPDFTGRETEAARLCELLVVRCEPGSIPIATIAGQGGIGKTALAVHVAHEAATHFPDGQLFLTLGGATNPLPAADVLARLLRDLGVPNADIPAAEDERAARYRTLAADRKLLIVLDDARNSAQVRPLLPGSGGSAVIITSRATLADLAGAAFIELASLGTDESLALFTTIVGKQRAADDPEGTEDAVASCAGLPLAIRIAASRLATRPGWTTGQLATLLTSEQRRLDELSIGDTALRASFEVSYLALPAGPPDPARVFRLFGLTGLAALSLPALAALTGEPVAQTATAVATLLDAHLLESPAPGQFHAHDLLRIYAAERAASDETDGFRTDALHRLLAWYLHTLKACIDKLGNARKELSLEPLPPTVPAPDIGALADAVDWLSTEHWNLIQSVTLAASNGLHDLCWQLAWLMRYYFDWSGYWALQLGVSTAGLAAAEAMGNKAATAGLLNSLGVFQWRNGRLEEATEHYERALAIRREQGDESGQASLLANLGLVEVDRGLVVSAVNRFTEALAIHRKSGYRPGEANCLRNLGYAHQRAGQHDEALTHYRQALAIRTAHYPLHDQAATLHSIGELLVTMGRVDEAMEHLHESLLICQENNLRFGEGVTLASIGDGYQALGKADDARTAWRQAYAILTEVGAPEAAAIRERVLLSLASAIPGTSRVS